MLNSKVSDKLNQDSAMIDKAIVNKTVPNKPEEIVHVLHPLVKKWFFSRFKEFSLPQLYGIMEVHNRQNVLISAPTGATKTLTSFLAVLNELIDSDQKGILEDRVYCVYVSPLKALSNDISVNLLRPLQEMEIMSGGKIHVRIGVRTGDTTAQEKAKMLRRPPHILITTPESLAISLTSSKFRECLRKVDWLIVDEIHALAENKRGVHMSLSVERLAQLSPSMTRVGLSATISPLEEIAKFLVGFESGDKSEDKRGDKKSNLRSCKIVNVQFLKEMDLKVLCPTADLIDVSYKKMHDAQYNLLHNLIKDHRTTIIFTNTRSATERVIHNLKQKFPDDYKENIGAHHGSLGKHSRKNIEDRLRKGEMKAVVCLEGNTNILNSNGEWHDIKSIDKGEVQSLKENLKLNDDQIVTKITTENQNDLLEITTCLGKKIKCTKEHKFLTINKNSELEWKEANELNKGDFVATIRQYNYVVYEDLELKSFAFSNYPDDGFIKISSAFLNKIRKKVVKKCRQLKIFWNNHLKTIMSYSSFRQKLKGKYLFKIKQIRKITQILEISSLEVFSNIKSVSSDKIESPRLEINEDLMRLLGFMAAEGYVSGQALFVTNRDERLLQYYDKIIEKLSGRKSFKKLGSTGTPILVWHSVFLSRFLCSIGFKLGRKARIINIPKFVFRLNKKMVSAFLSGYFDGDGFIEIKSKDNRVYTAGICTASKEMSEDLNRLLLREGIQNSIRSRYCDSVQETQGRLIVKKGWFYENAVLGGEHIRRLALFINPERMNLKRLKELKEINGHSNRDVIPNLGKKIRDLRSKRGISTYKLQKEKVTNTIKYERGNRNISRKKLREIIKYFESEDTFLSNLVDSDIFWEKIKSTNTTEGPSFVYNLEVKRDHNYVANGFLTKNCSTSLELGIDIGYVDLVLLLGSPKSVARCLQRIGRSGHQLHSVTKGRIVVLDRDDLVECSVLLKAAIEKNIDRIHIPKNCLDVLAQQIFGIAVSDKIHINELKEMVKRSYCYHDLENKDFMEVIDYLAGKYVSLEDRHIYAKIWHDSETGMIGKRGKMSRVIFMTNVGTIPDETHVQVKVGEHIVGTIDEAFLEKLKKGDVFVLGGNTYEFKFARGMTAQVNSSVNRPPTVPSWFSEMLPLSFDLAMQIGKFRRLVDEKMRLRKSEDEIISFINEYLYVDKNGAVSIYNYLREQYLFSEIPNDKKILIETFSDKGRTYFVFHTLFGRRVNDSLSRCVALAISRIQHRDVDIGITDNGFFISSPKKVQAINALKALKADQIRKIAENAIDRTEILARRFRHCATRAMMILRNYLGKSKRVGRQQVSSMILLTFVKRIDQNFSILKEAKREVLEDLMDIDNTSFVLSEIEKGTIKIKEVNTEIPSPFAFNLISQGYADTLKIEDRIEFLRRMHARVLEKIKEE